MEMAKLHSISLANSSRWRSFISEFAKTRVNSPVSFWLDSGCMEPWAFMLGGKSLAMNRSEPPAWLMAANSLCM
jgi:hypothetical protein